MSTFKTNEEVERLLRKHEVGRVPLLKTQVIGSGNHGKQKTQEEKRDRRTLTVEEKVDTAVLAEIVGNKAAGELMDLGNAQVSLYKHGKNGSGNGDSRILQEKELRLERIEEKALDKIDLFLKLIVEEKASELDADKLASSAEKMVNTMDKLRRRNEAQNNLIKLPQIIIQGPAMVKADTYVTKEV